MGVLDVIWSVFSYPVTINVAPLYSKTYASNNTVPFWLLIASFMVLFSVVWLASAYINLFKDPKNKNPRMMFVIAISFIALFGTPLAIWLMKLVYTFTTLSIIALLILGIYIIWTLSKSTWAESAKTNAESSAKLADSSRKNAETDLKNKQTKEFKEKTNLAAIKGIRSQISNINRLKEDLKHILSDFYRIKKRGMYPVGKNVLSRLAGETVRINDNMGKIISFNTENDRIMSLMSTRSYDELNTSNLNVVNPTSGTASLRANVESQTKDLGHSVSAIKDTVQKGISNENEINNLINWTESAINIATRMERDIVLEKQMIEKI